MPRNQGDIFSTDSQAMAKKTLPAKVLSRKRMSKARHPKPYKKGKKPITVGWKKRVRAKLEANEKTGTKPDNLAELARIIDADKRGIYVTFDLDREPQQMVSAYVDEICKALGVAPPLADLDDDEGFVRDVRAISGLSPEIRRSIVELALRLETEKKDG